MRQKVKSELVHIAEWPWPQAQLRMSYWSMRMASLGRKAAKAQLAGATPLQIVERCIESLKPHYPEHKFEFDRAFFENVSQ